MNGTYDDSGHTALLIDDFNVLQRRTGTLALNFQALENSFLRAPAASEARLRVGC